MQRSVKSNYSDCKYKMLYISLILLLAFMIRLIYIYQLNKEKIYYLPAGIGTDMSTYDKLAMDIATKGILSVRDVYWSNIPYWYFLGLIYFIFGRNYLMVYIIQSLIFLLGILLIYKIATKMFNWKVGLLSSFIMAIYPLMVCYTVVLLADLFWAIAILLLFYSLLKLREKLTFLNIVVSGILLGITCLFKAHTLVLIPFIFIWFICEFSIPMIKKIKYFLIMCLSVILTISPLLIRNYILTRNFIPISGSGSIVFYTGNAIDAKGFFMYPESLKNINARGKSVSEASMIYYKSAIKTMINNPAHTIKLMWDKIRLYFSPFEISDNIDNADLVSISPLKFIPLNFGIIASFAFIGFFLLLFNKKIKDFLILFLFATSLCIMTIIFIVIARYRLPIVPIFIILTAFVINYIFYNIKNKRLLKAISLLLVILLIYRFLHNISPYSDSYISSYRNYIFGKFFAERGNRERAIQELQAAIKKNPLNEDAKRSLFKLIKENASK